MIRNFFFILIGLFGGLWLAWPGITREEGWTCARDIVLNIDTKPSDSKSFVESFNRKLRLSSAVSPKTLLKAKNLGPMDRLRILGDACFRN